MFTSDPRDVLVVAHDHIRHLREETSANRFRPRTKARRTLAASLRRAAERLDPTALAPRAA